MFIEIKQEVECSKCGSRDYENFSDAMYTGMRCKNCGHESKQLHPHLRETSSGGTASWGGRRDVIKF